ncbi:MULTISPECIES: MFS transporter [unclassified Arthrobacter]|uniref:MFS transporter n=1 Tax=unclassified Arthrobacter TaxID=235627 RepID=UPI002E019C00|nr:MULTISPECIES: MFS transporter [unclassified Arthrobacter]MEC5193517.1 putative MFS family arabinose efflux permease [Arthrobacter sp. MP_M4]MEC5204992.1 putative MFS family arabinose efflux permease [Arthrobacter sp. MP_M7]
MTTTLAAHGMTRLRTIVFAIAAGLAVGNLYWAQPLIEEIASSLGVSSAVAASLVTVTQLGYALGIFLIVPLGDVLNRKRMIPIILGLSAIALLGAAVAPTFSLLLAALGGVGLTTVSAQLLVPLASELAAPEQRGRVLGTIASGALIGVLLSRTISGAVAEYVGWRAIYVLAAILTVALAVVLSFLIPRLEKRPATNYFRLLGSVFTTVAQHRAAAPTILISASAFCVFSLFWTSLTFLLSAQPFSFTVGQIGLFGLAGLVGAVAARRAGMLHDRGWSVPASGIALTLLAVSLVGAWLAQSSVFGLIVVVIVLDLAAQATLVLSQTRLLSLPGQNRSRLNTAIVVSNFLGGAIGSALAGPLWATGGWTLITGTALGIIVIALLVWTLTRRGALIDQN